MMGITAIAHTTATGTRTNNQTYTVTRFNVTLKGETVFTGTAYDISEAYHVTDNMIYTCASRGNKLLGKYSVIRVVA